MTTLRRTMYVLALSMLFGAPAWAQSYAYNSGPSWTFGGELFYQDSTDLSFDGGSTASVDDDIGFAFTFGYRFRPNLELEFGFDWSSVGYDANLQSALLPNVEIGVRGDYEYFAPRVNLNYYIGKGPIQPYIRGGIGWAFIDTNIPNSRVTVGCWWDPWYGQICTPYQSTKSVDEFMYQLGVGVNWQLGRAYSLRFGYEKQWIDFNHSSSSDFDQLRLAFLYVY